MLLALWLQKLIDAKWLTWQPCFIFALPAGLLHHSDLDVRGLQNHEELPPGNQKHHSWGLSLDNAC